MQTIFKDDPNFRLLTPGGIVEVPPDQFFLQPTQIQEELQRVLVDPTTGKTIGTQPGLEDAQQGVDGGVGAAKVPDVPAESAPETVAPDGQTAPEGLPQQDAGAGMGVADTSVASTPGNDALAAPAQSDLGATEASGEQTATEDSGPLKPYTAPTDTPAPVKTVLRKLSPAEKAFKKRLEDAGHEVIQVRTGPYKTPDFLVDGKEMELKSVTANGPESIKNQIQKAAKQTTNGQIVIDAEKSDATVESALSQCERAAGHLKLKKRIEIKGRVTVLTKSGPIRY